MKSPLIVFVCGTYSDLSEERGAILDALQRLQLRHHSMELFGARPNRPLETCLTEVRNSDILIVIAGNRYGSLVPELGISYSQAEYEEAYRLKRPCLVYIRENINAELQPPEDPLKVELLGKWKRTLQERHTPAYFPDTSKLAVQVVVDLSRYMQNIEGKTSLQATGTIAATDKGSEQFGVLYSQRFGDEARQLLHSLAIDPQGNIVLVGDFWGQINFGGSILTSVGDRDIFVAKFDRAGKHIWSKKYGDESGQVGVGIDTDIFGNIFVVSAFTGGGDFGGVPLIARGRYNIALAKLSPEGKHLWSYCYGDEKSEAPECIAVSPSGHVYVAGRFQGTIDFGGIKINSQSQQTDIFLAAFSLEDGRNAWAKRFGGNYEQQTLSIAVDAHGNIALAGVFKGAITFDKWHLTEEKEGDYCGFLAKFDQHGNTLWCKRFGEPHVEQGSVVAFDSKTGDLLTAGFIRNKLPAEVSKIISSVCFLCRYDAAGVLRWSKAFGTHAFPDTLAVAPSGQILLTGHFENIIDLGLGPLQSAGGYDLFAAIFCPDGTPKWSRRFGDPRQQFLINGAFGAEESIVLAGSFHGTIDFGVGPLIASGYDGTCEGNEDLFLSILTSLTT